MLGYVALIFILILVVKLQSTLKRNKAGFLDYGVSEKDHMKLSISLWLYILPLVILLFPVKPIIYLLYPIPFLIFFIIPGIIIGRKAGIKLSTCGIDVGVDVGKNAENVMWLGVGTMVFVLGNWGFDMFNLYLDQHFDTF